MTLHCSKNAKNFKYSMFDVDNILRGWKLKLRFSIFYMFDLNALRVFNPILYSDDLSHYNECKEGGN